MEDIKIDESIHTAIGMKIISEEESGRMRSFIASNPSTESFPKDKLFNPRGITLKEAKKVLAMMG